MEPATRDRRLETHSSEDLKEDLKGELNSQEFQIGGQKVPAPFSRLSMNLDDDEIPAINRQTSMQRQAEPNGPLEPIMS